ncbi:esterase family protein [Skermania sp. ID1734]|uniref:alpha/beta hydrolase n=1 Tax=Skermania sp. ID1734 TaxID=2597516 RepID=UPI00117E2918|nr:alpha/beta hydrolase family protein [Skermania sp. ID1734]TSD94457.1 esterase family protein [Skermania sp. ID1734]
MACSHGKVLLAAAVCAAGLFIVNPGVAAADPVISSGQPLANTVAADGSKLTSFTVVDPRTIEMSVHSAAMNRDVPVRVQRPADTSQPRPALYLLDGENRRQVTDGMQFLSDKNVNVVIPTGGENAYWTDWRNPDPKLGVNKWATFLSRELPPIINSALGTNGRNAAAGISRTGTAALQLAAENPGLYKAVAVYSGCADTGDPLGQAIVRASMMEYGQGDADNMWGPPLDPEWAAKDVTQHPESLRGVDMFISNGSGLPGRYDTLANPYFNNDVMKLADQIVVGGALEGAINLCAHKLQASLAAANIPATFDFRPNGTHAWSYWQDDFKTSWPVLAHGLGL